MSAAIPNKLEVPTDFGFTEEHALLRAEARRFLAERLPMKELRKLADAGVGFDRALWKELAQLGWVGLVLPESHGGAGLGWLHLAILMEEMGRRLVPGPFLGSLLAGVAIAEGGSDAAARAPAARDRVGRHASATLALSEAGGVFESRRHRRDRGARERRRLRAARPEDPRARRRRRGSRGRAVPRAVGDDRAASPSSCPRRACRSTRRSASTRRGRPRASASTACASPPRRASTATAAAAWHAMLVRGFAALAAEQVGGAESVLLADARLRDRRASSSTARSASSRP